MKLARETSLKKPVIIWKGGLTDQGSRAVASHTASMAGRNEIWNGFFRQTGAIQATSPDELIDLIIGFHCIPDYHATRMCVIGGGGAITVAAADALEKQGLYIHPFSEETRKAIQPYLPPTGNSYKNPVDIGAPRFIPNQFRPILKAVTDSDQVEAVVVEHMVFAMSSDFDPAVADLIPEAASTSGKPFIVSMPPTSASSKVMAVEEARRKFREWYMARSVPVFDSLERAALVLAKIKRYNDFKTEAAG